MLDSIAIEGGFQKPVFDAQTVFRAIMQAMAEPGTTQSHICASAPRSSGTNRHFEKNVG